MKRSASRDHELTFGIEDDENVGFQVGDNGDDDGSSRYGGDKGKKFDIANLVFYCALGIFAICILYVFVGKEEIQPEPIHDETTTFENEDGSLSSLNNDNNIEDINNNNDDDDVVSIEPLQDPSLKAPNYLWMQPRPNNLQLVFVGDSLRYSYLSLVYFLRQGFWFTQNEYNQEMGLDSPNNLVYAKTFKSLFHEGDTIQEFYYQTSKWLQPFEICDCMDKRFENRYYHDPILNNTIIYIHAHGHSVPLEGRMDAKDITSDYITKSQSNIPFDYFQQQKKQQDENDEDLDKAKWSFEHWDEFIYDYISQIPLLDHAKDSYLIANTGAGLHFFDQNHYNAKFANMFQHGIHHLNMTSVWKTFFNSSTDEFMCKLMDHCWNSSIWNIDPHEHLYSHFFKVNAFHFLYNEPLHRIANEELLHQLYKLPGNYIRYPKQLVLKKN